MGIPALSCKCIKACRDANEEVDLAKCDYLRSKTGNFKINNDPRKISSFRQAKNLSINTVTGKTEIGNIQNDNDNLIKETLQNQIIDENEKESQIIETYNNLKTVNTLNNNKNNEKISEVNDSAENSINEDKKEKKNKDKNDKNSDKNSEKKSEKSSDKNSESNSESNSEKNNNINNGNSKSNIGSSIKFINNFDKDIFFTEKLKKAEKNFEKPINYEKDYAQYCEDTDNEDMLILINTMNSNKGINHTKEEGQVIEYKGEKYLYIGELGKQQKPTGFGVLYTINGTRYEGNFNNMKLTGLGRYIDEEGTCYEGIFNNNNLVSSKAKIIKYNENNIKITYFGEVVDYKKNGKGEEISDEHRYIGEFLGDLRHGEGRLEFLKNGDLYEGEFNRGEITGKGLYIWSSNKQRYKGDFVKNIKHGKGVYKWPDGTEYEGEYVDGIREGNGIYRWNDGRVFKGKFKNGKPDGKGKLSYNGITINCEYKDGKPNIDMKAFIKKTKSKNI